MNKKTIQDYIFASRKNKEPTKMLAYQSVLSAIQERENRENKTLSEDEIYSVIEKEKKAFLDSYELFKDKKPSESLLFFEKSEVLDDLLPEKVLESEYPDMIDQYIKEVGAESMRDMGKVIGKIKEKFGISVDIKKISSMVKEKLQ